MLEKKLKKIFIFITIQKNANANQRNFFSEIIIKPICKPELFEKKSINITGITTKLL